MVRGPWFVTPNAVRRYMAFTGTCDFAAAREELLEACAETWERYRTARLAPKTTGTGAQAYRMGYTRGRYWIIVSAARRPEGLLFPVVDIGAPYAGYATRALWQVWRARRQEAY